MKKTHSNPIVEFCTKLINARGELLRLNKGNTSAPVMIKHEKVRKAFDYAKSINTNDVGWCRFLEKHEADLRAIMILGNSKIRKPLEEKFNKAFYAAIQYKKNG
jgi:hypothetical protein